MFLHIGNHKNLRTEEIIGIFDLDSSTVSAVTRKFLSDAEKNGQLVNVSEELPKAFLLAAPKPLCRPGRQTEQPSGREEGTVYLAQLAPQTLAQRSGSANEKATMTIR